MPTEPSATTRPPAAGGIRAVEVWKWIVIVLGVFLVAAFIGLMGRLLYLAFQGPTAPARAAMSGKPVEATVALPAGASARSVSLTGDRLMIHYASPAGDGVVVVDAMSGAVLSRLHFAPGR